MIIGYQFALDTGNSKPVCCRKPAYGPYKAEIIMTFVRQLLANLWINRCKGPWGSQIISAQKPHQEHITSIDDFIWRMCVNYRALNAVTKPFQYPIPRSDDSVTFIAVGARGEMYFISYWVPTDHLFSPEHNTFPPNVSAKSFSKACWVTKSPMLELSNGTLLFINAKSQDDTEEYYILLRHRFGCKWFLQVRVLVSPVEREPSDWLFIANSAPAIQPSSQKPINQTDLECARVDLEALFNDNDGNRINVPSPKKIVNPSSKPSYRQSRTSSILVLCIRRSFYFKGLRLCIDSSR